MTAEARESELVGLTETYHGHCEFFAAACGRCFGRSLMHDAYYFEDASFAEVVERRYSAGGAGTLAAKSSIAHAVLTACA